MSDTQLTIEDAIGVDVRTHTHRHDPPTSAAAAATVTTAHTHRAALVAAYKAHGPMTADEACTAAQLPAYPGRQRISDLGRDGILVDTGTTRPGATGRAMRVLALSGADLQAAS